MKSLDEQDLIEWAEGEGIEWVKCGNKNINMMRLKMAAESHFFPEEVKQAKKSSSTPSSPWTGYTVDQLADIADEHNLKFRIVASNDAIQKIWLS